MRNTLRSTGAEAQNRVDEGSVPAHRQWINISANSHIKHLQSPEFLLAFVRSDTCCPVRILPEILAQILKVTDFSSRKTRHPFLACCFLSKAQKQKELL